MLLCVQAAQAETLLVAVGANFTEASKNLIQQFEKTAGYQVKASYGSSGKLYAQIENAAPFEIFLSADADTALKTETAELAVAGTRFTYARGKLVLWSAKQNLFGNGEQYLKANNYTRFAIANPATAPYGLAAQQVLQQLGVWTGVQAKLVKGDSIAQAFQFVATQNAEEDPMFPGESQRFLELEVPAKDALGTDEGRGSVRVDEGRDDALSIHGPE